MPELKLEKSGRPRDEYIYSLWRIQIDLHPDGFWTWMVEQEKNKGVWFHQTDERPTFAECQKWINDQPWGK